MIRVNIDVEKEAINKDNGLVPLHLENGDEVLVFLMQSWGDTDEEMLQAKEDFIRKSTKGRKEKYVTVVNINFAPVNYYTPELEKRSLHRCLFGTVFSNERITE